MSLYLKYRPQDFESLVGQSFIKQTLQKALETHKMVSSYLLCGSRGTGKTTTARLLAKGVNCLALDRGNPCNSCEMCSAFNMEKLIDVIEIDAASYTGVDNIRDLIERAQFQPSKAQYKVYIIDEVHMLSKGAFNALLKTLEEPPEHVQFILATTETHKVPETILSRCQRYDFKNIAVDDIVGRLKYIAKKESVTIDEQSLLYIAKAAQGALRNAINIFEQLNEDNIISYQAVIEKLGLTGSDMIHTIYDKILSKDISVLETIHAFSKSGKNMQVFFSELLLYAKEETIAHLGDADIAERMHILDQLNQGLGALKHSFDAEVSIMAMVVKILGVYQELTPLVQVREGTFPVSDPIKNPSQESKTIKMAEKTAISLQDADEIFGTTTPEKSSVIHEKKPSPPQRADNGNFDKNAYIEALRSIKVKGALIISLKQARSFVMKEEYLEIVLQNNFTLKALNSGDNIVQLIQGLEQMGIKEKTVKLS